MAKEVKWMKQVVKSAETKQPFTYHKPVVRPRETDGMNTIRRLNNMNKARDTSKSNFCDEKTKFDRSKSDDK